MGADYGPWMKVLIRGGEQMTHEGPEISGQFRTSRTEHLI